MDLQVDRADRTPLYLQIRNAIRERILSGLLPDGFRLPPERRLAESLGVNRTTVLNAYRELKADGLVGAHVGRGTAVVAVRAERRAPPQAPPWRHLALEGSYREPDPLLRDLLEMTERSDAISLSVGLPAAELLPVEALGEVLARMLRDGGAQALLHCPTEGVTALREAVCEHMEGRGIQCGPQEVLISSGSQQGLDLIVRTFLEPGDCAIVEEPSYFGAIEAFRAAQVRLLGVPVDADGMRTDMLEVLLARHRPKLIYTLPTFQNPSGRVLSAPRRRHLLELAYRHQVPVLEDDSYWDLRYEGEPIPPIKALDRHGFVMYLSSFSKVLFPGLRLGWIAAPRPSVRPLALAKGILDLHSGTLGQRVLERFIREGLLSAHLERARREYATRRDALVDSLEKEAPRGLSWMRPTGGFYLWCRIPQALSQAELLAAAAREGVSFIPGSAFFAKDPGEPFIRLAFSSASPDRIREGVRRLARALSSAASRPGSRASDIGGTQPIV